MARRAGLAAANSRDAEPQREKSYELARDNQRAGNNHERREHIQKSPFAFPSRFWDPIATDIRANPMSSGQSQQKQRFSMAPLERCDSDVSMFGFSALADKSHGAACRYAQIHYAGHCRQQPYERLAVEIDDIRIHGSGCHRFLQPAVHTAVAGSDLHNESVRIDMLLHGSCQQAQKNRTSKHLNHNVREAPWKTSASAGFGRWTSDWP